MVFIDLEKAYDRVHRYLIWWVLNKRNVSKGYSEIIKDMYQGVVTNVGTFHGDIGKFLVTIVFH